MKKERKYLGRASLARAGASIHGDYLLPAAAQACPLFSALLEKALELIRGCDCVVDSGCPGCIQHTGCSQYNAVRSLLVHKMTCC